MNNLSAIFKDGAQLLENPLSTDQINWAELGVNRRYIIFMTGRCGSTWLTHMLDDTKICGRPDEFFNEDFVTFFKERHQLDGWEPYIKKIIESYKGPSHFGFEINPLRFKQLIEICNFDKLFRSNSTHCFWLTRRDILSQAYSFAIAKKTGHWHTFSAAGTVAPQVDMGVSDKELWAEIYIMADSSSGANTHAGRLV